MKKMKEVFESFYSHFLYNLDFRDGFRENLYSRENEKKINGQPL